MLIEREVTCPGCGEHVSLSIDTSGGERQRYYEDCSVCCRPMDVRVRCAAGGVLDLDVDQG
jgi:formate dehydrogenase maturation protein FdhE